MGDSRATNDRAREAGGARRDGKRGENGSAYSAFQDQDADDGNQTTASVHQGRNAIPFYEAFGRTRIRLLHNVDDPTQFVQVVEYETEEAFEMNRQRVAGDPTLRAFLQTWRTLVSQAIEIDVYEDVTDAIE